MGLLIALLSLVAAGPDAGATFAPRTNSRALAASLAPFGSWCKGHAILTLTLKNVSAETVWLALESD
jgi:hypothetical protein